MKLIVLFLITVIITAHPKYVEAQPPSESAEELAHEGIKNLMQEEKALISLFSSSPQLFSSTI